jgi:hypothetical protein
LPAFAPQERIRAAVPDFNLYRFHNAEAPLFEALTLSHCASNPSGWEGGGPLQGNACNIGLREIIALEKKGQVPLPRERIGETVSVVQPGRRP